MATMYDRKYALEISEGTHKIRTFKVSLPQPDVNKEAFVVERKGETGLVDQSRPWAASRSIWFFDHQTRQAHLGVYALII